MAGRELTVTPTKRDRRKSPAMASCSTSQQPPPPPPPMSPTSSVADTTFEPTVDMMVNDFDDEATLNEEEALADLEAHNVEDEIATLRAESEMPIELLLAKYGSMEGTALGRPCSSSSSGGGSGSTSSRRRRRAPKRSLEEYELEQEQPAEPSQAEPASPMEYDEAVLEQEELPPELTKRSHRSHLLDLYPEQQALEELESFTPLETLLEQAEDEDQEDSDTDSDDTKKIIMVGPDYQADIPEGLALYVADILPYENEDQLIWAPSQVSEKAVEDYLAKIQETRASEEGVAVDGIERSELEEKTSSTPDPAVDADADPVPAAASVTLPISDVETVVKDNEQALHLLVQCGYDFKEALRRKRMNVLPLSDTMSSWSEEECQKFEEGIQKFGKDFYQIRQNQVRTRTMRELVHFYYLWKKSERRDQSFALNDTIDHMDVFINEGSNGNGSGNGNGNGNGSCSSLASSGSSSNGHSNGNAALEYAQEKDAAAVAAVATATPAASVGKKCTTKNYSIMTGGTTAAVASRKRDISFAVEDDNVEQENGLESLS